MKWSLKVSGYLTGQGLYDHLFDYANKLGFGEMHIKMNPETGLMAFIAIHSTTLGPAIGGCRYISYNSVEDAMRDAFRLAASMTYKAAVCGLNHGGAKSVIIRNDYTVNREVIFKEFGQFLDSMNGRYITAVDSGTSALDMDIIALETPYVTCTTESYRGHGDTAFYTAVGVLRGIMAAVEFRLGKKSLEGVHVAIQGLGHVGYYLAKQLHEQGAKLTVTDIEKSAVARAIDEFNAKGVEPNEIFSVDCDVFAPCALGAVLNVATIPTLKCKIIAGSANNQLAHHTQADEIFKRNILYVPDFVINSGGLIHVAAIYDHGNEEKAHQQIFALYDTIRGLLQRAQQENASPSLVAEKIAAERLHP